MPLSFVPYGSVVILIIIGILFVVELFHAKAQRQQRRKGTRTHSRMSS